MLFREEVLLDTDRFIRECLKTFPQRPMSTAELHHLLGRRLLEIGVDPQNSVVAMAARWNVPIYTSSPGDSSIGMNLARHQLDGGALTIDPLYDVHETTALVHAATRNGVIILGGGSPKNFYLQTQPQLWEVLGINKGGHDYFIQITQDAPHWGGYPARRPRRRSPGARSSPICSTTPSSSTPTRRSPSRCWRPTPSRAPRHASVANSMRVVSRCSTTCARRIRRMLEPKRRDSAKARWRLIGIAESGDYSCETGAGGR